MKPKSAPVRVATATSAPTRVVEDNNPNNIYVAVRYELFFFFFCIPTIICHKLVYKIQIPIVMTVFNGNFSSGCVLKTPMKRRTRNSGQW
jgi:hypothetical protein